MPLDAPGHGDGYLDLHGRRFYRIADYDRLAPFFMTVVGAGDAWLFISSTGGVTAGRAEPDSALFPYYTDDKVSEGAGQTGGLSVLRVGGSGLDSTLWEPFGPAHLMGDRAERNLYKDVAGTALVFEEAHRGLGLRLRITWQTSSRFGVVRSSELANIGAEAREVELIDGFVNVLPAGIDVQTQIRLSNLLDAYKRSEVDVDTGLGMFWLSSRLTDFAEPSESLRANVAWQVGLGDVPHLASTSQLAAFRGGGSVVAEHDVRGQRGAYLVRARIGLEPGEERSWSIVGDVDRDAAETVALRGLLTRPDELEVMLQDDLRAGRAAIERIVASADGLQCTGDELATSHHFANVLFNVMRGGVPADGYRVRAEDVRAFVEERSSAAIRRNVELLAELPEVLTINELIDRARASGDVDLQRLAREYLPLTFSRRHGDPSRPWNSFRIAGRAADGGPLVRFEGNWRDIFQNWEALAWSFPEYVESMVTVFLDATTADGYNPYRISRSGIDWEVPEPGNPWANIGYWSDHQIIYLLRLMETSARFHPGRLQELLDTSMLTHADVPYRLATYAETLKDPRTTVAFDDDHARVIEARVAQLGADGRLVHGADGDLVRVSLTEKLLVLLLAKLANFVPDGGIWMNTQRPEWNDANNALVGFGLSVVTLAQLRRYIEFAGDLLTADAELTEELADQLDAVGAALQDHRQHLEEGFTDATRREFLDDLGAAATEYRERVYAGFSGQRVVVSASQIQSLLSSAQRYIEASLSANAREDSLYHSYNILDLTGDSAGVRHLAVMLEGQVAILSSGYLGAKESLSVLSALRNSALYRADQHSYLLYPDKDLPGFLDRNRFPESRADSCALVGELVARQDRSIVVRDVNGDLHFASGIRNARDVEDALDRLGPDPTLGPLVESGRSELLDIFEEVFNHAEFTGRSGSFFAYEGLGSIYWHMVSKLLLAVQETLDRAVRAGEPEPTIRSLITAFEDVRAGLGYCKSPDVYGAFPSDPYSHTPAGHGARQPGMTGQVKEEVLTRLGELGLQVEDGTIVIRPIQLRDAEWTDAATSFAHIDVRGSERSLDLPAGSLAFTFCQVPVVYRKADAPDLRVRLEDGGVVHSADARVPPEISDSVFQRLGQVSRIEVGVPAAGLS